MIILIQLHSTPFQPPPPTQKRSANHSTHLYATIVPYIPTAPIHVYSSSDNPRQKYMGQHPRFPIQCWNSFSLKYILVRTTLNEGGGGNLENRRVLLHLCESVPSFLSRIVWTAVHLYGSTHIYCRVEERSKLVGQLWEPWRLIS